MFNIGFLPIFSSPQEEPVLREAFDGWQTGDGIFNYLSQSTAMPWASNTFATSSTLDLEYFGNRSGGKYCSPIVKLLIDDEGLLSSQARQSIANLIVAKYLVNWQKLWATMTAEYNPIHNYDMTEESDTSTADDRNISRADSSASFEDRTDEFGKGQTITHGRGETDTTYRYGMNNTEPLTKPAESLTVQESGTTGVADTGSNTSSAQSTDSSRSSVMEGKSGTEHHELRRYGNIGVTTSQKMLQSERDLWTWNYFDQIFKDLDAELGLMYQDPCRV